MHVTEKRILHLMIIIYANKYWIFQWPTRINASCYFPCREFRVPRKHLTVFCNETQCLSGYDMGADWFTATLRNEASIVSTHFFKYTFKIFYNLHCLWVHNVCLPAYLSSSGTLPISSRVLISKSLSKRLALALQ